MKSGDQLMIEIVVVSIVTTLITLRLINRRDK